jgi:hypothetical protein
MVYKVCPMNVPNIFEGVSAPLSDRFIWNTMTATGIE